MANPIKGIDRIDARILAEAESYAAAQADEAEKQAQALLDAQRRKTAAKTEEILSRARTQAQALTESAESSAGMRERNALLALKVEMADKAFSAALEKLTHMPQDRYVPAMAALLADAVNGGLPDGAQAYLSLNERDMAFADAIIRAAEPQFTKNVTVACAAKSTPIRAGFLVICGDIELNCSGETLIAAARDRLEKPVLDILFGA